MPFKYSCFISYRHHQGKLARRIINDLYTALTSELELLTGKEIFLDWQRLEAGYLLDESLATGHFFMKRPNQLHRGRRGGTELP